VRADAVVVFVVHTTGDEVRLLAMRRTRGAFVGSWTPVMGGVEAGETAVQTARRELQEETGIVDARLATAGILDVFYDPIRDRAVHVPFFVAYAESETVAIDEAHDAFRWLTFAEAAELYTFGSHRNALPELHRAFVDRIPDAWRWLD
jgi:dATP pyrophosphohydrolase